jgi:3-dehydroquinate synthase
LTIEQEAGEFILGQGEAYRIADRLSGSLAGRRIAIVTDREVSALHLDAFLRPLTSAGARCFPVIVDAVGSAKSLDTVKTAVSQLADNGFSQGDLLIGLGGGGVLDVAAFCASVYRGGLACIRIPTTLYAMVALRETDRACLNLSGSKDVLSIPISAGQRIVDPAFLETLSKRQYANGIAEIVRLAYLADPSLLEKLESGEATREDLMRHAVAAADTARAGQPAMLGFGRQAGDVIEEHFRFIKYTYGEVCALGMMAVSPSPRLAAVLERFGLPVRLEGVGAETLSRKMVKAFFPTNGMGNGIEGEFAQVAVVDEPGRPRLLSIPRDEADAWFAEAVAHIAG